MYHQDWLMRQIELVTRYVFSLLAGRGKELSSDIQLQTCRQTDGDASTLGFRLAALVRKNQIGEAENLLFAAVEEHNPEALSAGLQLYRDLNALPDERLEQGGFSREEILSGLKELCAAFGYNLSILGM